MNVLMISPGFPVEQPFFTRGLHRQGGRVIGIGDSPESALPEIARQSLAAYFQVPSLGDTAAIVQQCMAIDRRTRIDRVECTWEPYVTLAAQIRQALGVPGMIYDQVVAYRDKERMKQILDQHGIRTPRHAAANSVAGVREAIERVGYPVCIKPIAGAGSADTYRVRDDDELAAITPLLGHVPTVSVEEFIEGSDYTFDTICVDGQIQFFNIATYRPRALIARQNEWISPQTICLREVDAKVLEGGRRMGQAVLEALEFQTGFTHMEWFLKPSGEVVFGEIAARPPGSHTVDLMNYANDCDLYDGWAEAVLHGRFSQSIQRRYNAGHIFKRARGQGQITAIEGIEGLLRDYSDHICVVDLLPIGATRRNWKQTLRSDGMVIARHPDLESLFEILDQIGIRLQMDAN